jgi:hypothetical protein
MRNTLRLWRREYAQFHFAVGFVPLHSDRTIPTFGALFHTLATVACVFLHPNRTLPTLRAPHQSIAKGLGLHGVVMIDDRKPLLKS